MNYEVQEIYRYISQKTNSIIKVKGNIYYKFYLKTTCYGYTSMLANSNTILKKYSIIK